MVEISGNSALFHSIQILTSIYSYYNQHLHIVNLFPLVL
ncbi:hypothetical protein BM51_0862 [Streptococcus pneumoniae]|nr:hypothetical protein BM49_0527 [Streptococcus pneumoniae]KGI35695.1 hypothetical protein X231_0617 [Streptococcus pneumoniae ECC_3510]KGI28130.1 hypothetical protein BM50_1585 [Streptococcus pneumoniae]KGI31337.1 hypothetical protein BM51_0862 [Streptococcus pneumoniae]KGI32835.1 hypothetical protein BM48_1290 [Streptococcus pneumoniae]